MYACIRAVVDATLTTPMFVALGLASLLTASPAIAQQHQLYHANMPPREIGQLQVQHRPQLRGMMQPVRLRLPEGAQVAIGEGGGFRPIGKDEAVVSLSVGEAYRLRVSDVPHQYGDIYPTVELIDRMHAPPGKEVRFAIPIDITTEELRMALRGQYVMRVIYVEDPKHALGASDPQSQRYFEVLPQEDPLRVANNLGRPVAILRMGSLAPGSAGPSTEFLFGSPPFLSHPSGPTPAEPDSVTKAGEKPKPTQTKVDSNVIQASAEVASSLPTVALVERPDETTKESQESQESEQSDAATESEDKLPADGDQQDTESSRKDG